MRISVFSASNYSSRESRLCLAHRNSLTPPTGCPVCWVGSSNRLPIIAPPQTPPEYGRSVSQRPWRTGFATSLPIVHSDRAKLGQTRTSSRFWAIGLDVNSTLILSPRRGVSTTSHNGALPIIVTVFPVGRYGLFSAVQSARNVHFGKPQA
jgi:hypothetical protein